MKYTPISCNLYDRIESLSVLRKKVQITYSNDAKTEVRLVGIIEDIFFFEGAEYLLIENVRVRMDHIKSIIEVK